MTEEILSNIVPLIRIAENEGADDIELYALLRKEKNVSIESNSIKTAISGYQEGVGIRVLVNKSLGFSAVNSFERDRILAGIKTAISIAKVTPPQEHYSFPERKEISAPTGLYDKEVDELQMDQAIGLARELLGEIHNYDSRLSVDSAGIESRSEIHAIATSNGIESDDRRTSISWGILGWAVDGEDIGTFHLVNDAVVSLADSTHITGANQFSEKAINSLNAQKTDSFKGSIILSPRAVIGLFYVIVVAAMGHVIQGGNSYLADKLGEEVAIKGFTIRDNGTIPNSVSSGAFDREGLPHTKVDIIDSGVFKGVLHNAFSANKAGLESTGNSSGTYRQAPSTSPTNVEISGGSKSFDEMVAEVDKGIYVERLSSFPDSVSGDFSAVIKGGKMIEKGEIKGTLKEITATGNLYDGLKRISALSKKREHFRATLDSQIAYQIGSWHIPYIGIDDIDFAA